MIVRKKILSKKSNKIKMFQCYLTEVFKFIRAKINFSVYVFFFYGFYLKRNSFEMIEM